LCLVLDQELGGGPTGGGPIGSQVQRGAAKCI